MKTIFNTETTWKQRDYQKLIREFVVIEYPKLFLFCFDVCVFLAVVTFFTFGFFDHHINKVVMRILKVVVLSGSFYVLVKFTITNFFYPNTYFRKIVLYHKSITIQGVELKFKREIRYQSVWFVFYFVVTNIIITIILNDESETLFVNQKIITALVATSSSLLLVPSFVSSLGTIFTIKKEYYNPYKILIRNQFLSNLDLFNDFQEINNFEQIKLKKLDITNKRGILLLNNFQDEATRQQVTKYNHEVIAVYHDLWKHYCNFLFLIHQTKPKYLKQIYAKRLQHLFDAIFIDFFAT